MFFTLHCGLQNSIFERVTCWKNRAVFLYSLRFYCEILDRHPITPKENDSDETVWVPTLLKHVCVSRSLLFRVSQRHFYCSHVHEK